MKIYAYPETALKHENIPNLLENWRMLAMYLELRTSTLSYLHQHGVKDKLVRLSKKAPKRDTYGSLDPLLKVQNRVKLLLDQYYYKLPDNECMQAYIKGRNPYEYMREHFIGKKLVAKCDIRGYFDNVTRDDIFDSMKQLGFPNLGAKYIAHVATMNKKVGKGRGARYRQVLQQGSKCSPAISNYVGYYSIDVPIMNWLKSYQKQYPKMTYKYMRYCDNLYFAFDGEVNLRVKKDCTEAVIAIMNDNKLKTHKWDWTPRNSPRRNQVALGVVLNHTMRIDKEKYFALRALLFNLCVKGIEEVLPVYFSTDGISLPEAMIKTDKNLEKIFYQKVQGGIAFTKKVNENQYRTLTKLFQVGKLLNKYWTFLGKDHRKMKGYEYVDGAMHEELLEAIKMYNNNKEGVAPYVQRVKDIIARIDAQSDEQQQQQQQHLNQLATAA